jgi:hypothetical protein
MSQHLLLGVRDAVSISAAATELANGLARGFYCGGSGDATFTLEDGTSVTFTAIAAGVIHPIRFIKMTAFDGTAALALY